MSIPQPAGVKELKDSQLLLSTVKHTLENCNVCHGLYNVYGFAALAQCRCFESVAVCQTTGLFLVPMGILGFKGGLALLMNVVCFGKLSLYILTVVLCECSLNNTGSKLHSKQLLDLPGQIQPGIE